MFSSWKWQPWAGEQAVMLEALMRLWSDHHGNCLGDLSRGHRKSSQSPKIRNTFRIGRWAVAGPFWQFAIFENVLFQSFNCSTQEGTCSFITQDDKPALDTAVKVMGFAVRVRSAGQKYGPTCHQRDCADVTEFVTLVRLSSLGQHVGAVALAGYKRRKSALTAGPIAPRISDNKHTSSVHILTQLFVYYYWQHSDTVGPHISAIRTGGWLVEFNTKRVLYFGTLRTFEMMPRCLRISENSNFGRGR